MIRDLLIAGTFLVELLLVCWLLIITVGMVIFVCGMKTVESPILFTNRCSHLLELCQEHMLVDSLPVLDNLGKHIIIQTVEVLGFKFCAKPVMSFIAVTSSSCSDVFWRLHTEWGMYAFHYKVVWAGMEAWFCDVDSVFLRLVVKGVNFEVLGIFLLLWMLLVICHFLWVVYQ